MRELVKGEEQLTVGRYSGQPVSTVFCAYYIHFSKNYLFPFHDTILLFILLCPNPVTSLCPAQAPLSLAPFIS